MKITIKLFATLRKNNLKEQQIDIPENAHVADIIPLLNIRQEEVSIIMVNGRIKKLDHVLKTGDIVALFPLVGGG